MGSPIDFSAFSNQISRSNIDPARAASAGRNLIDGALRIRRGGDGLFADVEKPVTKPAEALGAWINSMEQEIIGGGPFHRSSELREALIAAGEEIDAAAQTVPAASRLRSALYSDALGMIGSRESPTSFWPWIVAATLGGILIGVLVSRK